MEKIGNRILIKPVKSDDAETLLKLQKHSTIT